MWLPISGARLSYRPKKAYTLLEVTLVSVIILILVTVSMPLFRKTYEELEITSLAKDISQTIHFSRQRAIFERKNYRFRIDSDNNTYQVLMQDQETNQFRPPADRWGRAFRIPAGIQISTDTREIDFRPSGMSLSVIIYLIKDSRTHVISVNGNTGSIEIYEKKE